MKHFLAICIFLLSYAGHSQSLSTYDHTVEYKSNPIGIDTEKPRFSWKVNSDEDNIMQSSYELQVAATASFADMFWKTGKVSSDQCILIPYEGPSLTSGTKYFWRVRIEDNKGNKSPWSSTSSWEMGLLNSSDWIAKWIEPQQEEMPNGPGLLVRNEFSLDKAVSKARAYVTAHGIYELSINGKVVGDQVFTPGWTVYDQRLQYQVYDVTDHLKSGKNAIGAELGDGWYRGHLAWQDNWGVYGKKLGLLCQVEVTYEDGGTATIITDSNWKGTNNGPITLNSLYNGETYDASKEMKGWDDVNFKEEGWAPVEVADYSFDNLIAMETVPVRKIQEIKPIKIWTTPKGTLVADMGQNMVGWIKLKVKGKKGDEVVLRYAEVMDKYGEFYTVNLRAAKATTRYILKGKGTETYEPKFTFMGFRYVAVEGFPGELKPENLTGVVIHSDMKVTGSFECSNPLINQLQSNILWGQKGNFLDVPTDCPQRDERLGWTGDAQAFISTAAYNMDVAAFFTKWLKDLIAEQGENGMVPVVIPNAVRGEESSTGWGDVATIAPWTIFQVYGDRRMLENQYESMKAYTEYMANRRNVVWKGFGDWLYFKPEITRHTVPDGHTNQDLLIKAFIAYSAKLCALTAEELGKEEDAVHFKELFEKTKKEYIHDFVTPAGRVISDSQTSYVLSLMFGLLPDDLVPKATQFLVDNIRSRGNHLSTGFLGTPYLCRVLSENGQTDVAYDLLLQETFPSWLYPVTMGATTIWERWDGQKPDSTFQDPGMNSFNHYAYGAIGDWMYKVVTGLDIGKPGYKHILIQPQPDSRLKYAKALLESMHGTIKSQWKIEKGHLIIEMEIPANTTATIRLPKASINKVKDLASGKNISEIYKTISVNGQDVVIEAGSGSYGFEYATSVAVVPDQNDINKLKSLLQDLEEKEDNELLKMHFASISTMMEDNTHDVAWTANDSLTASYVLNYFQNEGALWNTYAEGPRPLIMSFKSPSDGKNTYYWLVLPKEFDPDNNNHPLYVELHGSGGGKNNNPRQMLFFPLQPEIKGVTNQGYRKEGFLLHPWGRGDKWYRDQAENDIFECLEHFDKLFKTDPSRQYLYGFSMGGGGTFRIAQKSMDRWAAIGMYSAALRNPTLEEAKKFKDMPVWMTWGEKEWRLTEINRKLKDLLIEAGVDLKWTEVEGVGHAYLGEYQNDLMDWFLDKKK
jgi:alpha-L-rhamnosidase